MRCASNPAALATWARCCSDRHLTGPLAVVSDSNVAEIYAPPLMASLHRSGYSADSIVIPAGEAHKTFATVQKLLDGFINYGLDRSSTVVALGGGVVGDLAGFAAAIFLRGVRWVAVPTSLLAMVDASLGGKTGADLPQGKNLVGAFHPPALVLADLETLATLPEVELRNGLAEVIKHGLIGDPQLFDLCSMGITGIRDDFVGLIRRAVAVKVSVIRSDPYEQGPRATLNLGHTLGHGLELATDFKLRHGEAVSIGTVAAARLAERMKIAPDGLAEKVEKCLERLRPACSNPSRS